MLVNRKQSGFSMIELMIGLAIGLIISVAVVAFIAATLKANSDTIRSMKLNSELRSLAEVIARDVRRARSFEDPIANIGTKCNVTGTTNLCAGLAYSAITIPTSLDCILYAYDSTDGNDYRAIRLVDSSGVGQVNFDRATTARSCGAGGTKISSDLMDITELTFENCEYVDPADSTTKALTDCINITVSGRLVNDPDSIVHTYRTSVGVRSGRLN